MAIGWAECRVIPYYGDNLRVLRDEIGSETVDRVYLDPPFNSNANYNLLFRARPAVPCDVIAVFGNCP